MAQGLTIGQQRAITALLSHSAIYFPTFPAPGLSSCFAFARKSLFEIFAVGSDPIFRTAY